MLLDMEPRPLLSGDQLTSPSWLWPCPPPSPSQSQLLSDSELLTWFLFAIYSSSPNPPQGFLEAEAEQGFGGSEGQEDMGKNTVPAGAGSQCARERGEPQHGAVPRRRAGPLPPAIRHHWQWGFGAGEGEAAPNKQLPLG